MISELAPPSTCLPALALPDDVDWLYYWRQGGYDDWKVVAASALPGLVGREAPRYVTALATTFDGQPENRIGARYFGDFYIDWDGKAEFGGLEGVIRSVQRFAKKLTDLDVSLDQVRWYASGGRGFHAEVPLGLYAGRTISGAEQRCLPAVYKEMVLDLYTDGMDLAIYSGMRGRMWRQPNVARENQRYKVPVSFDELLAVTVETYEQIVSSPRDVPVQPAKLNPRLAAIYTKASMAVAKQEERRPKAQTLTLAQMGELPPGKQVIELVKLEALKDIEGLLDKLLPRGHWVGDHYVVKNPMRDDHNAGSFMVWANGSFYDFACPDDCSGGDLVALYAELRGYGGQMEEAARDFAEYIGFDVDKHVRLPAVPSLNAAHAQGAVQEPASTISAQSLAPVVTNIMDLLGRFFPPVEWVVEDLLPPGLTLLAAAPKVGKSWLALDIAVCVAGGVPTMGGKRTKRGDVLYLALEDNERRLQDRLLKVTRSRGIVPEGIDYATSWNLTGRGGTAAVEEWLQNHHPNGALVVVDTLARVKDDLKASQDRYAQDYKGMKPWKDLSDKYSVAILVITHDRKVESSDPLDAITGSKGLTGGADNAWILKKARGESQASLFVIGRDIEKEFNYGLQWDQEKCIWSIAGSAADVLRSAARQNVLNLLKAKDDAMTVSQIAEELGRDRSSVQRLVESMNDEGCLSRTMAGRSYAYSL